MAIVRFYGDLKQFGDKFKINANTGAEALRCLFVQIPGLRQHIMNDFYRVRINGRDLNENEVSSGMQGELANDAVIHLVPHLVGAKNGGLFSIIAGVALIAVGCLVFGATSTIGFAMVSGGAGLALGGVAMMLTNMPVTESVKDSSQSKNTSFSSLDNTIAQGSAVPICYGKMMIGSKVLSQGIETL